MRKFLVLFLSAMIFCPAGFSMAQGETAGRPEVSEADVAAVAAYRESTAAVSEKMKQLRKEIREKNSALAKALGKTSDYSEQEVTGIHKELTALYALVAEVELESFLLYKTYNPEWAPDEGGRRIVSPVERDPALTRGPDHKRPPAPPEEGGPPPKGEKKPK